MNEVAKILIIHIYHHFILFHFTFEPFDRIFMTNHALRVAEIAVDFALEIATALYVYFFFPSLKITLENIPKYVA